MGNKEVGAIAKHRTRPFREILNQKLDTGSEVLINTYTKESFKLEVALMVRKLREEKGLSQRDFAREVGLTQAAVSRIETGQSEPTLSTLYDIFHKCGKHFDFRVEDKFLMSSNQN